MKQRAPSITRAWKRFLAVGCSHAEHIDPQAEAAILKFKKEWRPDYTAHLGDAFDTAAFRRGAKGTSDETADCGVDLNAGRDFLKKLRPTVFICGNHEDRLWQMRSHYNAVVKCAAETLIDGIESCCAAMGCEVVPYSYKAYRMVGNYKLMHGTMFGENAARDHAEAYGNCVFAHTHKVMMAKGRRDDNPTGICVGTLSNVPAMDYAKTRRATLAWSAGFVWGEFTDTTAVLWLHENPQGQSEWRLPI